MSTNLKYDDSFLNSIDNHIKLYDFIMYSMKYSKFEDILNLDNVIIDYGADDILNYAYSHKHYNIIKFVLLHIDDEQYIIDSTILPSLLYIYSIDNSKKHYEIFEIIVSKFSDDIMKYVYELMLDKNYRCIQPLYKLLVINGCDINKIKDETIKTNILNLIRIDKLNKILL